MDKASTIVLNEQRPTTIIEDIPINMRGLGSLTIPSEFGNSTKVNALADPKGSINLTPYSFYEKVNLTKLNAIRMAIHMTN